MIILELEVRQNGKLKDHLENQVKILEENLCLRDKEIEFLKERLKNYDENTDEDQFRIFENEINNIRYLLKEKTLEFLKMEIKYKKNYEESCMNYNVLKENFDLIKDENNRLNEAVKNISNNLDNNNKNNNNIKKIGQIISSLNINHEKNQLLTDNSFLKIPNSKISNNNESLKKPTLSSEVDDNLDISENNNKSEENDNCLDNEFANKVIKEFDIVFNNELKRIEKYLKKNSKIKSPLLNRVSFSNRRSSGERNYIEWKAKSINDRFAETLRSRDNSLSNNKSIGKSLALSNNSLFLDKKESKILNHSYADVDSLVNEAKLRVKSSIHNNRSKNFNGVSVSNFFFPENPKHSEKGLKIKFNRGVSHDKSYEENDLNLSKFSNDPYGVNHIFNINLKKHKVEEKNRE